jgi:CubicO group peptidase (beta-lactamase class C family)
MAAGLSAVPRESLAAGIPSETSGFDPQELKAMEGVAEEFRQKYDAPGLSVAFAKEGRLVYAEGFGFADTAAGEKVTARHRFRIASVSKPITSVALMNLMEQGRLKLSDRVFGKGALLGTDFGTPPYGPHIEEITVEHLLTHTCGGWQNDGSDPMFSHPTFNHAQLISWTLDNQPLLHEPGKNYAYSNFGFCVLGRIIEKLTDKAYDLSVKEAILRRCGITEMEIAGNTLADRRPNEVVYYGQEGENPYNMPVARMDSHGGWLATPTDLVRLAVRVDGFPTKPDILKASTLKTMTTPSPANAGYAKGWLVNSANNWWHNGSLPGSITIMVRTSGGFCWAALTNTRKPNSDIALAQDKMMWEMVGKITTWPQRDLFNEPNRQ